MVKGEIGYSVVYQLEKLGNRVFVFLQHNQNKTKTFENILFIKRNI